MTIANPTSHRRAVFPGQFDPITNGHLDIIRRSAALFDEVVVAVGVNPEKREIFSLNERVRMIRDQVKRVPNVRVEAYVGLTVNFVRKVKAIAIIRGIRDAADLRYEFQLALANRAVGKVETVFIMTGEQYALTSSSLIRQVAVLGGDVRELKEILPAKVIQKLLQKIKSGQLAQVVQPDTPVA